MLCSCERNAYFLYSFRARVDASISAFQRENALLTCNSPLKNWFFLLYFTPIRLGSRHATRALSDGFGLRTLSL